MLKALIGMIIGVAIGSTAVAQEAKRSELELLFLRMETYLDTQVTLIGELIMADETSAILSLKADRLGSKSISIHWKDKSGEKWEEIQLQCAGAMAKGVCKKAKVTGHLKAREHSKNTYYLADADYEFIK